jgi:3-deoxy-7-phosphoheptulonate synthase
MTRTVLAATAFRLFPSPEVILAEIPLPEAAATQVERGRAEVRAVLDGTDDRLLVIAGPCSVHDPEAALEYAERLAGTELASDLLIVIRAYFEKPRTVTGWAGLMTDPGMDGSFDAHRGVRESRRLLADIAMLGLPAACEFLNPAAPHYFSDAVAWAAVGARTTESQIHRQLASSLPMPVGFKNAADGDVQVAAEACRAAAGAHTYLGINEAGMIGIVSSPGNPHCHVVLRGGRSGPNYAPHAVAGALDTIQAAGLPRLVLVDASHGNSGKSHRRQEAVAVSIAGQVAAGELGIAGVMLESNLVAGRQEPGPRPGLVYGQSVTDPCMDWAATVSVLETLAAAVRTRRTLSGVLGE